MRISVNQAALLLTSGNVVGVPTETVYGLAASLYHSTAIEKIFTLKGRPSNNPLIVHLGEAIQVQEFVKSIPDGFVELAQAFWPGPLTIVLDVQPEKIPNRVRAGLQTAAFRVPSHPKARQLLQLTGPLVMPSANLSGTPSSTRLEHVEADFGINFPVMEGECCSVGVESTIIIFIENKWQIIRQGALPPNAFKTVLGYMPLLRGIESDTSPLCPGQLFRHYAPRTKLLLSRACDKENGTVIVGYCDRRYPSNCRLISLGHSTDPNEITGNLYVVLRSLDDLEIDFAVVDVDLPVEGIYATILERLYKASQSNSDE